MLEDILLQLGFQRGSRPGVFGPDFSLAPSFGFSGKISIVYGFLTAMFPHIWCPSLPISEHGGARALGLIPSGCYSVIFLGWWLGGGVRIAKRGLVSHCGLLSVLSLWEVVLCLTSLLRLSSMVFMERCVEQRRSIIFSWWLILVVTSGDSLFSSLMSERWWDAVVARGGKYGEFAEWFFIAVSLSLISDILRRFRSGDAYLYVVSHDDHDGGVIDVVMMVLASVRWSSLRLCGSSSSAVLYGTKFLQLS